jgi:hypothetical protein
MGRQAGLAGLLVRARREAGWPEALRPARAYPGKFIVIRYEFRLIADLKRAGAVAGG